MPTEHSREHDVDHATDPGADRRTLDALRGAHALLLDEAPVATTPGTGAERISAPRRGRRTAWVAGAVAAGVLLAAGAVVTTLRETRDPHAPLAGGPYPASRKDLPVSDPAVVPHAGWKWVSVEGVTLEVPRSWGWGEPAGTPSCAGDTRTPHVVRAHPIVVMSCRQPAGHGQQPVVQVLSTRQSPAATVSRVVGQRRVQITWGSALESPQLRRTAQHILASAHEFRVDVNGCPVTPGSPSGTLDAALDADRGVVCQYAHGIEGGLTAVASRPLDAAAARRLARALADAPAGEGPNPPKGSCTGEDQLITVLLHTSRGVQTITMHYAACDAPNGVVAGDGHYHRLTRADCLGALGEPVRINVVPSSAASVCMRT